MQQWFLPLVWHELHIGFMEAKEKLKEAERRKLKNDKLELFREKVTQVALFLLDSSFARHSGNQGDSDVHWLNTLEFTYLVKWSKKVIRWKSVKPDKDWTIQLKKVRDITIWTDFIDIAGIRINRFNYWKQSQIKWKPKYFSVQDIAWLRKIRPQVQLLTTWDWMRIVDAIPWLSKDEVKKNIKTILNLSNDWFYLFNWDYCNNWNYCLCTNKLWDEYYLFDIDALEMTKIDLSWNISQNKFPIRLKY